MKKHTKILSILLTLFLLILVPMGCGCYDPNYSSKYTPDTMPKWTTAYTEQEHFQKVEDITKAKNFSNPIADIRLETVYSYYTEDPEYILITLEHKNYYEGSFERNGITYEFKTKYSHTMIQIIKDEYYYTLLYSNAYFPEAPRSGFCYGVSAYELCGYINRKKYCTSHFRLSVEDEKGILKIYDPYYIQDYENRWEYDFLDAAPRNEYNFINRIETGNLKKLLFVSRHGYQRVVVPGMKY